MKIDVCMVAGRRPDLIQTTLDSFNANLFRNFTVDRFIVNIDPVFGSDDDQALGCVLLLECGEDRQGVQAVDAAARPEVDHDDTPFEVGLGKGARDVEPRRCPIESRRR